MMTGRSSHGERGLKRLRTVCKADYLHGERETGLMASLRTATVSSLPSGGAA
jgi:hypothetical protein